MSKPPRLGDMPPLKDRPRHLDKTLAALSAEAKSKLPQKELERRARDAARQAKRRAAKKAEKVIQDAVLNPPVQPPAGPQPVPELLPEPKPPLASLPTVAPQRASAGRWVPGPNGGAPKFEPYPWADRPDVPAALPAAVPETATHTEGGLVFKDGKWRPGTPLELEAARGRIGGDRPAARHVMPQALNFEQITTGGNGVQSSDGGGWGHRDAFDKKFLG